MSEVHAKFHPLHARLCGVDEELAQVPAHTLLALYPVELASYAPFLQNFYTSSTADGYEIFNTVQGAPIATVEQAILGSDHSGSKWVATDHLRSVEIPLRIDEFIGQIDGRAFKRVERVAIKRQLAIALRSLMLLSDWNEEAFSGQKKPTQRNFMAAVDNLTAFYGVKQPTVAAR